MYRAKRAQSRCEFFSLDIEDEAPRRLILVTALKRAIDIRAITMHYQPKLDLATGAWSGSRRSPAGPTRSSARCCPTTFVPLAERTGLAEPLTELALEIAATDAAAGWTTASTSPVAVNVPARVLLDPTFPDLVEAKRLAMGLDESALEIEITESTLMGDHDQAREALTRLREHRRAHLDRRLRHRLLVALLPARAARARAQDRPLLHHRPLRRARLRGDRPLDHRARAQPAARDGRGGCRGRARLRAAPRASAATTRRASRSPARCRRTTMRRWLRARVPTVD